MDTVIFDVAYLCLQSFEDIVAKYDDSLLTRPFSTDNAAGSDKSSRHSSRDFLGLRNSFSFWVDYTGALSLTDSSLDTRLWDLGDISAMVIELLEMVLRGLQRLNSQARDQSNSLPDSTSADADVPQAILSRWDNASRAIDSALDRLHFIATAIRKASAKRLAYNVATFLTEEDLTFRRDAASLVRFRFPNARKDLCNQLGDSIAIRRRLLLDKYRHALKLKVRRDIQLTPSTAKGQDHEPKPQPIAAPKASKKIVQHHNLALSGITKASRPDPQAAVLRNLRLPQAPHQARPALSSVISTVSISPMDSTDYPPPPEVKPRAKHFQCPYCLTSLDVKELVQKGKQYWERHVDEDLEPYVCLFPECAQALVFFPEREAWRSHLESVHTKNWTQKVHNITWYCDIDHQSPEQFETKLQWSEHMKNLSLHPKRKLPTPSENQLEALSVKKQQVALREPFVCPLCEQVPEKIRPMVEKRTGNLEEMSEYLIQHIAKHIKSLSLISLPCLDDASAALNTDKNSVKMKDSFRRLLNDGSVPQPPSGIESLGITSDSVPGFDPDFENWNLDVFYDFADTGEDYWENYLQYKEDLREYTDYRLEEDEVLQHYLRASLETTQTLVSTRGLEVPALLAILCANDRKTSAAETPKRSVEDDYTVGWIGGEYAVAQACLDERHEGPEYASLSYTGDYTLGKIGNHNVVISVVLNGEYRSLGSIADVTRDMVHRFPNIRVVLMVGVGSGAPSKMYDIRLGDIVVNDPDRGLLQYDFDKTVRWFKIKGVLVPPPRVLQAAVDMRRMQYRSGGYQLENTINSIFQGQPRLREKYMRPSLRTDRLYQSHIIHPLKREADCAAVCGNEPPALVSRPERIGEEGNPVIHYGLIASMDHSINNASVRDALAVGENVLCFEMEAADMDQNFPCLVVRGICDYADSHKNKEWQRYAAMVAAAYAKDLLCYISPDEVEAENKIAEVISVTGHPKVLEANLAMEQQAMHSLSDKQNKCLQLFRLCESTQDSTYEWYKDRVEQRLEGTCMWFLEHNYFQEWLKEESVPLLVSADPGCGKSVLAKYLIDHVLPRTATVCYFFFNDQDQNTIRQALCALLHQLFSQRPLLIHHAMQHFEREGSDLVNSTKSLWAVLGSVLHDPHTGPVIIVLDALDECAESGFEDLMWNMERSLRDNHSDYSKVKYLLTSRPYEHIIFRFRGLSGYFPGIRISGEEQSETISEEVNRVIQYRVARLAREQDFSDKVQGYLAHELLRYTHRTYLWVYLMFEYLETEGFKKTPKGVKRAIITLPKSVEQAYERILSMSKDDSMVRKALTIVLAAERPLTVSEMKGAVSIRGSSQVIDDIDLEEEEKEEEEEDFKVWFRSWCGLFLSIHHGKIYLIHETAREFLLADPVTFTAISTELQWHHSITLHDAHEVLAQLCVRYLTVLDSDDGLLADSTPEADSYVNIHTLLDYSAKFWTVHFREACASNETSTIVYDAMQISDPDSKVYWRWSPIYWDTGSIGNPGFSTVLLVASYLGLGPVVKVLLRTGMDLEQKDDKYGCTPLCWAAGNGHEEVVKLLLDENANLESEDYYGQTPLSWAAKNGHEVVVRRLLDKGADLDRTDKYGRTPLSRAAGKGYEEVVKLLLDRGADLESKDSSDRTPLSWATMNGHKAVVKLLLDKEVRNNSRVMLLS